MRPRLAVPLALLALGVGARSRSSWSPVEADASAAAREMLEAGVGQVLRFETARATRPRATNAASIPIVMMHGMGDFAENTMGMVPLRELLGNETGAYVHSVAICSDPDKLSNCNFQDQSNGFFMPMDQQVDQFARVVRADPQLANGFHAVGLSQGNTIIRGYIHRYNDPPVRSFVSMHGVLMGVAGLPHCSTTTPALGLICQAVDRLTAMGAYTSYVQAHLAQANYYRDPTDLATYRRNARFLPYINNEIPGAENATYKANFVSLDKLVLVMASDDSMVHPKESEHFGYYKDNSTSDLQTMQEAPWYTEDWFGLKSMDEAKKIDFYTTPGDHLRFTDEFFVNMAHQYFAPEATLTV